MKLANVKLTAATLVAALALVAATGTALADNQVMNADFETGDFTSWLIFGESGTSVATIVADNGPSAPGTNAVFLDNQAQALALTLKQSTEVGGSIAGPVDYSFDLKLGTAAVGGVFFVEIFAEQEGVGIIGTSGVLGNYTPADWTTFSGVFEAPVGTDFLTIQLSAITGADPASVSSMYVDNVVLDQGTVATEASTLSSVKALFR